jgi:thioredoxin-like negative regulator of GroEL
MTSISHFGFAMQVPSVANRRSAFEAMIEFVTKDRAPNHDEPRLTLL